MGCCNSVWGEAVTEAGVRSAEHACGFRLVFGQSALSGGRDAGTRLLLHGLEVTFLHLLFPSPILPVYLPPGFANATAVSGCLHVPPTVWGQGPRVATRPRLSASSVTAKQDGLGSPFPARTTGTRLHEASYPSTASNSREVRAPHAAGGSRVSPQPVTDGVGHIAASAAGARTTVQVKRSR